MNEQSILAALVDFLGKLDANEWASLDAISKSLGIEKAAALRVLLKMESDFAVEYGQEKYDPNCGPLFALRVKIDQDPPPDTDGETPEPDAPRRRKSKLAKKDVSKIVDDLARAKTDVERAMRDVGGEIMADDQECGDDVFERMNDIVYGLTTLLALMSRRYKVKPQQ